MLRANSVLAFCLFLACIVSGCGGGTSSTGVAITSLSPASAGAGSPDLNLAISGSNLDLVHPGATRRTPLRYGLPTAPLPF